ncbi:MAG: hypothetical protein AB8H80_00890 [Planctomycetota bacterium]
MSEPVETAPLAAIDDSVAAIEATDGAFEDFDDGDFGADDLDEENNCDHEADTLGYDATAQGFVEDDLPPAPALLERLCGLIAAVFLTAFFMLVQGSFPADLFQPVPILLVLGVVLGGLIASNGPRMVYVLLGICLGMKALHAAEARALHNMCAQGRRLCYVGGLLQVVTSLLHVLSVLDQPIQFGPAIAASLTGVVFATMLAELGFGSVKNWIRTCLY